MRQVACSAPDLSLTQQSCVSRSVRERVEPVPGRHPSSGLPRSASDLRPVTHILRATCIIHPPSVVCSAQPTLLIYQNSGLPPPAQSYGSQVPHRGPHPLTLLDFRDDPEPRTYTLMRLDPAVRIFGWVAHVTVCGAWVGGTSPGGVGCMMWVVGGGVHKDPTVGPGAECP